MMDMKRLVLAVCLLLPGWLAYPQQAKPLQFREELYDFGFVKEDGGPVLHQFDFTNTGTRPIKILSVKASCGCTTPDWSRDPVMPGKTGYVQASFNPQGRPGYFNKSLTVTTDHNTGPIILQIKGQVRSNAESPEEHFKAVKGHWRLKTSLFNLGKVYRKDEFAAKEFPVVNAGDKAIAIARIETPSYIKVEAVPGTLAPGEEGKLLVSYNGALRDAYGFQSDHIDIHTDDVLEPVKSFSVYATLEDYFEPLSPEALAKAPHLRVMDLTFDLGSIPQFKASTRQVSLVNTGKSVLEIRALQPNCTCITATSNTMAIQPGMQATLEIAFNPKDREGTQQKSVMIYSNDPQNPVQRITFTANVQP